MIKSNTAAHATGTFQDTYCVVASTARLSTSEGNVEGCLGGSLAATYSPAHDEMKFIAETPRRAKRGVVGSCPFDCGNPLSGRVDDIELHSGSLTCEPL